MQRGLGTLVAQVRDASGNIATASQEIATGNQGNCAPHRANREQRAGGRQFAVGNHRHGAANGIVCANGQPAGALASTTARVVVGGGAGGVQHALRSRPPAQDRGHHRPDRFDCLPDRYPGAERGRGSLTVRVSRAGALRWWPVKMRSLAQRSAAAASDIKVLIQSSVSAVDGGVRHVEDAGTGDEGHREQRERAACGRTSLAKSRRRLPSSLPVLVR